MSQNKDFKLVFMGTPDFAVTQLNAIVEAGFNVAAVVTVADKPAGRGQQLNQSAVKQAALELNIPILQPTNLKDEGFLAALKSIGADLFVVVAFRMLPHVVWSMPEKGTINLHASLLPAYRGAAPINWAIINGEIKTGVTTFFIEQEIDTGKVIDRQTIEIGSTETVGELHDKLMHLGAKTLVQSIQKIARGDLNAIEQDELITGELRHAPKIFKADCQVNWNQDALVVHNFIRGLDPYPAAWSTWVIKAGDAPKTFKLFSSELTAIPVDEKSIKADKEGILFPCKDFFIRVKEIQPEGKRRMKSNEFLAGYSLDYLRLC